MTLANQSKYARSHGVSKMAVSKWKSGGFLVLEGKLINVEKSDAVLEDHGLGRFSKKASDGERHCDDDTYELTPEARALLHVLLSRTPAILADLLLEYGLAPADCEQAAGAFIDLMSYLTDGLTGTDDGSWQVGIPVKYPRLLNQVEHDALCEEQFKILERVIADMDDPKNPLNRARVAGRFART